MTIGEQIKNINSLSEIAAKTLVEEGVQCRFTDLTIRPFHTLISYLILKGYIFKGVKGTVISTLHAYNEFITYLKLWEFENVIFNDNK